MSEVISYNGQSYIIPDNGDTSWGQNLTNFFVAIPAGCLQKIGGAFTLTAETDFGATYGLKSAYLKSRTANPAATGVVRLANNSDGISWRNAANGADLALTVDGSNRLSFNGVPIESSTLTSAHILVGNGSNVATDVAMTGDVSITNAGATAVNSVQSGTITNAMVNAAAAIAYSKLALTGSIVNADINSAAAIAYSKLNLALSVANADISTSAAIAYSKLALTGSIVNADVSASAAIAYSKLNLATSIVNADVSASAAIAYSKLNLATSIVNADIGTSAAIAYSKLALTGNIVAADLHASAVDLASSVVTGNLATSHLNSGTSASSSTFWRGDGTWAAPAGSGTVNSGTAGRLSLYATSTTAVSDTYVQNSQNIVVAIAAQASRSAGLVITIPNPGDAATTANVLLSEGAQTINGAQTFTKSGTAITVLTGTNATASSILVNNTQTGAASNSRIDLQIASTSASSCVSTTYSDATESLAMGLVGDASAGFTIVAGTTNLLSGGTVALRINTSTARVSVHGTTTNDSASAGFMGEYIESVVATVAFPSTGTFGDLTSITLSAGDWDVTALGVMVNNGGTSTVFKAGISTTTGNSSAGLVTGSNFMATAGTITQDQSVSVPNYRMSLTGSTVVYLKVTGTFTGTAPTGFGRLSARRVR